MPFLFWLALACFVVEFIYALIAGFIALRLLLPFLFASQMVLAARRRA
jgi:hypothetical protein